MRHILLNYAFLLFWSIFGEIHREYFFLDIKVTISETSTEIPRKFFFYHAWKGEILRKIWICLNNFFYQTCERGKILTKTFFAHKVSHILLNYAFLFFLSIFGEIHRELFFLDINVTILETSTEILRNFFFLTMFERG